MTKLLKPKELAVLKTLLTQREDAVRKLTAVRYHQAADCSIGGVYQKMSMDPDLVDELNALLTKHVQRQIARIDLELLPYGINIDIEAEAEDELI